MQSFVLKKKFVQKFSHYLLSLMLMEKVSEFSLTTEVDVLKCKKQQHKNNKLAP